MMSPTWPASVPDSSHDRPDRKARASSAGRRRVTGVGAGCRHSGRAPRSARRSGTAASGTAGSARPTGSGCSRTPAGARRRRSASEPLAPVCPNRPGTPGSGHSGPPGRAKPSPQSVRMPSTASRPLACGCRTAFHQLGRDQPLAVDLADQGGEHPGQRGSVARPRRPRRPPPRSAAAPRRSSKLDRRAAERGAVGHRSSVDQRQRVPAARPGSAAPATAWREDGPIIGATRSNRVPRHAEVQVEVRAAGATSSAKN